MDKQAQTSMLRVETGTARVKELTGSLLKKTNEVCVKINHLFFHDVHPIPLIKEKQEKERNNNS